MDTEFCLGCDKQSTQGIYCSQACRLADIERGMPLQTTPYYITTNQTSATTTNHRFSLPASFDFASYTRKASMSLPTSPAVSSNSSSKRSSWSMSSSTPSTSTSNTLSSPSFINPWKVVVPMSMESRDQLQSYDGYFTRTQQRSTKYKRMTFS